MEFKKFFSYVLTVFLEAFLIFVADSITAKLITLAIFGVIIIFFGRFKVRYERIYNTLISLAQNNKLHPIREMIMIMDRNMGRKKFCLEDYPFKIEKLIASYQIKAPHAENGAYSVEYELKFQIRRSVIDKVLLSMMWLISKKSPKLCFFRICESERPSLEEVKIEDELVGNVVFEQATLGGPSGDDSEEFGGLFKCSFEIPTELVWGHKHLDVRMKYVVANQIIEQANKYTFVIIAENYGRKVDEIQMLIEGELNLEPKLQRYSPHKPYYGEDNKFRKLENQKYEVTFTPSKMCVYIAQVDLRKNSAERTDE